MQTRRSGVAFVYAVPIGLLDGLIGLGGAEFRLPVLVGLLRYSARQAVPLNLVTSLVMHNTFLLAGSATDPAKVVGSLTLHEALAKIAKARALFVSRGDGSGTHLFEQRLWGQAGIMATGPWCLTTHQGMGRTLEVAGTQHAYVLTDRATYLAFRRRTGLVVLFEGSPELFNPYHVMEVNPERRSKNNAMGGRALADFFLSATVQNLLATFGVARFGERLFSPDAGRTEEAVRRQFFGYADE